MKNLLVNWRTTILGAITGGTISLDAIIQQGLTKGWPQALIGVAILLIGLVAKDGAVTGIGSTATTLEKDALPLFNDLTANSTNATVKEIHNIVTAIASAQAITPAAPVTVNVHAAAAPSADQTTTATA